MKRKLNCIMLIDDNAYDNELHEMEIEETGKVEKIITYRSAEKALDYLKNNLDKPDNTPQLILLDINMPGMNGWDFLEEYEQLNLETIVVVMLTTSINQDDQNKANSIESIRDYLNKPLTTYNFINLLKKHMPEVLDV
ncbi:response regulator [Fulvivirga ligni]|uniref:response regulator n=1 Tax=Fulvivirga ligni TaxID=2904246 RepID=UPI001F1B4916|nr:response regulator [Fulvivirga ligni]UII18978.1 response regulator [Fulvivirga ligni]